MCPLSQSVRRRYSRFFRRNSCCLTRTLKANPNPSEMALELAWPSRRQGYQDALLLLAVREHPSPCLSPNPTIYHTIRTQSSPYTLLHYKNPEFFHQHGWELYSNILPNNFRTWGQEQLFLNSETPTVDGSSSGPKAAGETLAGGRR